ncbi:MAG: hypothetical protein ACT4OX_08515 [Actinomycetota bacterium]
MGNALDLKAQLLFDEGPGVGLGHRRRMQAVAVALADLGWRCRLAPINEGGRPAAGFVTVVDSYGVRADELVTDGASALVVAVDDLYRDLAVDVLIDPSPGADAGAHRRAARVLAGADYALVERPRPRLAPISVLGSVHRVLVTTGGADTSGAGATIARAIRPALHGAQIRLVIGAWGSVEVPDGVIAVSTPTTLTDEIAAAPIVVTAGGVTLLEACLLGRAVVAVVLAENQRTAVETLGTAGAVVVAEPDGVADAVVALAADPARRHTLAVAACSVLDGRGPERVAGEINRLALSLRAPT